MQLRSLRSVSSNFVRRRARLWRVGSAAFLAVVNVGAACTSASGPFREDAPTQRAAPPPPDFAKLDAEIDAILYDDWPQGDPNAYGYVPAGKRDPFRPPPDVVQPAIEPSIGFPTVLHCPSAALAGVHVDELRLEGIVRFSRGDAARATIAGPDGRGFIVALGDELSDECASVVAILDDSVVLDVPVRTQRGHESQSRRILRLRNATDERGPIE